MPSSLETVQPKDQSAQLADFDALMKSGVPGLALAPMQDVTDLPFMKVMHRYGGPDIYFTEYFRVHPWSRLSKSILRSILENPTGRPIAAQMIGNDVPSLVRTARDLQSLPIASVDLNLGCPAPVVYKKCAGGGLLRDPQRVDRILGALRDAIGIRFTVKTRIGFDDPSVFDDLLPVFARHSLDLLTIHGRTVKEMYKSEVHYEYIARAVEALNCPVYANGNVYSARKGESVLNETNAAGLMIGRGAIRNPWLFQQIRQRLIGEREFVPAGRDVLEYIRFLYETLRPEKLNERSYVQKMKKYMNFIGLGVSEDGEFLHRIRRVQTEKDFFHTCESFLDHDAPMKLEPQAIRLKERDILAGEHR